MADHYIDVYRYNTGDDSTIGCLLLDGKFLCHTCEDEPRAKKVSGETRIPAGEYPVTLRSEATLMNQRYAKKFGEDFHQGMLWLLDVPGFTFVYIHVGNDDDDTEGCLLVGYDTTVDVMHGGGIVGRSVLAYTKLYGQVTDWLIGRQESVNIRIHDNVGG